MERPLILVGGGGHCRSVIEAAESSGLTIAGILDIPRFIGTEICGYKVIGSDDDIQAYVSDTDFVVTIGHMMDPRLRLKIISMVVESGGRFGRVFASSANISRFSNISEGTVVLHNASINAGTGIGKNCIINTASNIEHDAVIGDNVHVSTGAMINGGAIIGTGSFIGSGAIVCNGVKICPGCIIGAGCVVTRDITEPGTYVGVPARRIRYE